MSFHWSKEQKLAFDLINKGVNVFLTGPAGTGKSTVIKECKRYAEGNGKRIALCSTTGVSALLIGGKTIHSWAGIGLGNKSATELAQDIRKDKWKWDTWRKVDVLVIDEVSMLNPDLFRKLEKIGRHTRGNEKVFGGIQVVLTGDFCQLPPVQDNEKKKHDFCFQHRIWKKVVEKVIVLEKVYRQAGDQLYINVLNEARLGELSEASIKLLSGRIVGSEYDIVGDYGIKPTKLYSKRVDVSNVNEKELEMLIRSKTGSGGTNNIKIYKSKVQIISSIRGTIISDAYKNQLKNKIDSMCNAEDELRIVIGAQVMLIWNLNVSKGLVNGSRGVVIGFCRETGYPIVRFLNGQEIVAEPVGWNHDAGKYVSVVKYQVPLIIAYAQTIHKCQGASLDLAVMDLGDNVFEYGQAYTALSRVRNLNGLYLEAFDPDKVICHPDVIEFYKKNE